VSTEKNKDPSTNPFLWVDALCQKNSDPMSEYGEAKWQRVSFMVTRAMSQYQDCLFQAAELNLYRDVPAQQAYDYYMKGIRAKKRFAKWGKKKSDADVQLIQQHYGYSRQKAEEALRVLTEEQVEYIRKLEGA
jgi:hypothetical protein